MYISTWGYPCWELQGNWQSHYPYGPGSRGIAVLSLELKLQTFYEVCAKTSNCGFLLTVIYSPRLLTYRDLLPRIVKSSRCAVLNNSSACLVRAGAQPHLIPSSLDLCLSFLHSLVALARIPGPKSHGIQ